MTETTDPGNQQPERLQPEHQQPERLQPEHQQPEQPREQPQPDPHANEPGLAASPIIRTVLPLVPLYLLVPVLFALVFLAFGYPLAWGLFGIGAVGWWIAYLLRMPISLVLSKGRTDRQPKGIVYFSGPLEEGVRLVALLIFGTSLSTALSIGQGWAAIEVVFAIVQGVAITSLKYRTDEKAMQAKAVLAENGIPTEGNLLWGVVERLFASAFHIGAALVIAWNPWLVIVMTPLHTLFNVSVLGAVKRWSIAMGEAVAAGFGAVVLAAGLFLHLVA
ncbi:hypothetical protein [Alicyclobacillus sp. ALC3]|uniref:hypothetical protein n=1 Tax=Alicyclobacillus sp. ALC3 TaxID=2796143 RepID=UPI002379E581|nr:hypothetical protein [Alicyclobacillus sp. ALC3]WDL99069.1 hypothetical protein JC200_10695 [Alicyclobacillus sp. ALC3]